MPVAPPLTLIFGKDTSGLSVVGDLIDMPHLLVAGTTGSGKSMCLLSMIAGMILKSKPQELRLLLIDPKMLELSCFDGIGHMLMPVITDMNNAANALAWCAEEMDRRYKIFLENGVRNIDGYNKNSENKLYRIVIIVDEFSDLFLTHDEIEDLIIRIAQKARAAGIHLILATQRPSADVITGLIKANIPARIALKTTSKINSNIILDQGGAETLLGKGDMLVGHDDNFNRVHGAYLDHDELLGIISKIKNQYSFPNFIDLSKEKINKIGIKLNDVLFEKAIELIKSEKSASKRLFMRKLKIGHMSASELIDRLEEEGYVSLLNDKKLREVLI